jgi:hypothetical protein
MTVQEAEDIRAFSGNIVWAVAEKLGIEKKALGPSDFAQANLAVVKLLLADRNLDLNEYVKTLYD